MSWRDLFRRAGPGSPLSAPPVLLPHILVPDYAVDAGDPYQLIEWVVWFVNETVHASFYKREEIPLEALLAFHVDYYLAQVNNGGHSQFALNSGCNAVVFADVREGLAAIGAPLAAAIFSEFAVYQTTQLEASRAAIKGGGVGKRDPHLSSFDSRFYAGAGDEIRAALNSWLSTLECLRPLSQAEHSREMDAVRLGNPYRAVREAEQRRQIADAKARDPLWETLAYITSCGDPSVTFVGFLGGWHQATTDGVSGGRWRVQTSAGISEIYIDPVAALYAGPEGDPVRVSTTDVERTVRRRTGHGIPDVAFGRTSATR